MSFQLKSTTKVVITKFLWPTFAKPKRTCEKPVIKNEAPLCGIKRKFWEKYILKSIIIRSWSQSLAKPHNIQMMIKSNSVNSKITKIEPNWEPRLIQSRKLSKLKSFNKIKLITKYLSYTHTIHNLEQDLQEIQKELYGLENIK